MKTLRIAGIVFLLLISATAVSALPQWWVNLFGLCDDGDDGPTKLDVPLPFIGINSYARDKAGTQFDWCVDEDGNKKNTSDIVRERYCTKEKKVGFKDYTCLEYGLQKCVDTPRGAACVRKGPGPFCGDGRRDAGEQCDPPLGNCMTPAGTPGVCDFACKCQKFRCGDKIVDPGEECDPPGGNCMTPAGQQGKCMANCRCQSGRCGNSRRDPGEQCDPPGVLCMTPAGQPGACNPGCQCVAAPVPPTRRCGNNQLDTGEQCDPPNAPCRDADGFEGLCTSECSCSVTRRPTGCGNNRVDPGEDCDPPGRACRTLLGVGICSDGCRCRGGITEPTHCGNNRIEAGEQCDPPNAACRDAAGNAGICTEDCSRCYARQQTGCGNNRVEPGEQCDPPGSPAHNCPTIRLPGGGCGYPLCLQGCRCPPGTPCTPTPVPTEIVEMQLTGTQPVTTTPTPTKSCDELCRERGLSTQPTDHSQYILSYVQQYQCVSGARITLRGTTTLSGPGIECRCYSPEQPQISIDQTPPICQTPCGAVQCGSSSSCPCPDTPNCVLTVSCSWGGWKMEQGRPAPILGTQSGQQTSDASRMQ